MPMPQLPVVVTAWEREKLRRALGSRDGRVVRRAQIIELARKGTPVSQVMAITGYTDQGIRDLKRRWNERGEDSLEDAPRSGRPPRAGQEYRTRLVELVGTPPAQLGYAFTVWTTGRLAEHMAQQTGIRIGADRLRQILHELNMSWKRPCHTTRNLPDAREHERARKRIRVLKGGLSVRERDSSCGSRTKPNPLSCRTS
jgi:transposase